MELLQQAIDLDPGFAKAYSEIGLAYSFWVHGKVPGAPDNAFQLRQEFAQKALELDETLAFPHELLGFTHLVKWEWESARKEFLRALALEPNLTTAHASYAFYLLAMGRREEALTEMQRAQNLDPLEPIFSCWVGQFLRFLDRHQEAIRHLESALELAPDHVEIAEELVRNYARLAKKEKVYSSIREYHKLRGDEGETVASAAKAFETGGWAGYLEWSLEQPGHSALVRADWLAELDRRNEALTALEQALQEHESNLPTYLLGNAVFDSLHDDPRFQALLRRMNLPE
jgi:tetratricopeptide (TPR) repeat protein